MKLTCCLLIIATLLTYQNVFGQVKKMDTTFIFNQNLSISNNTIFIEKNKYSSFYKNITSFNFREFENESYAYSLNYLKANKIKLVKHKPILPSTNWIPLKLYKGNLYAYCPCDFYTFYKVSINDTTYIDWTGEGPIANKIKTQNKINQTTFKLKVNGINQQHKTIIINIIDKKNGIAIFTETTKQNGKNYFLMIMAKNIKIVPLIVNNCINKKQPELIFDEPNFEKLLANKK